MNDEQTGTSIGDHLHLLRHPDIDTRWKAAGTLCRCGQNAVEPLLKTIYTDDAGVRVLSIWALGRIGDSRAIPHLERFLHDGDPLVTIASEGALSRLRK